MERVTAILDAADHAAVSASELARRMGQSVSATHRLAPMYLSVPDQQAMVLVDTAFQSIGLGFGSAAGISTARPDRTTVYVTGDGGGLMGLADSETLLRATGSCSTTPPTGPSSTSTPPRVWTGR